MHTGYLLDWPFRSPKRGIISTFLVLMLSLSAVFSYACWLTFCKEENTENNREVHNYSDNRVNIQNRQFRPHSFSEYRVPNPNLHYPNSASSLISDTTLDRNPLPRKNPIIRSRTLTGYPSQNTANYDNVVAQRFSYTAIPEESTVSVIKETDMSPETRQEWGQLHRLLGTPSCTLPRQIQKVK